jgi:hypothetical protein
LPLRLRTIYDPAHRRSRTEHKELAMPQRARIWIAAVAAIAATGLTAGLAITAGTGVNQTHTNMPLAGITFNGLD